MDRKGVNQITLKKTNIITEVTSHFPAPFVKSLQVLPLVLLSLAPCVLLPCINQVGQHAVSFQSSFPFLRAAACHRDDKPSFLAYLRHRGSNGPRETAVDYQERDTQGALPLVPLTLMNLGYGGASGLVA